MTSTLPDVLELRRYFHYDPITGVLVAIDRQRGERHYRVKPNVVELGSRSYSIDRVIWRMATGHDPGSVVIGHRDGNPRNRRLDNLYLRRRERRARGVYAYGDRWRARIRVDGRLHTIGIYSTEDEARAAYERQLGALRLRGDKAP